MNFFICPYRSTTTHIKFWMDPWRFIRKFDQQYKTLINLYRHHEDISQCRSIHMKSLMYAYRSVNKIHRSIPAFKEITEKTYRPTKKLNRPISILHQAIAPPITIFPSNVTDLFSMTFQWGMFFSQPISGFPTLWVSSDSLSDAQHRLHDQLRIFSGRWKPIN